MANLFVLDGFLAEDECLACIWAMDAGTRDEAEVLGADVEADADVRRADDIEVDRAVLALVEDRLDQCRDLVARHFSIELTSREGAGFVRYLPGGFYTPHVDRAESVAWPAASRRRVAAIVFLGTSTTADLSGDFEGGILRLFPAGLEAAPVDVVPRRGTLVAFPATMLHEVTVVRRGIRDAIIDWYY